MKSTESIFRHATPCQRKGNWYGFSTNYWEPQKVLREGRCRLPLNSLFKMIQLTDLQHHELIGRGGHPRHVWHLAASSGASRRRRVWQDVFDPTDWWKEAVVSLGTFPHGRLHLLGAVATYWRVPGAKQASSLIKLVQGYAQIAYLNRGTNCNSKLNEYFKS